MPPEKMKRSRWMVNALVKGACGISRAGYDAITAIRAVTECHRVFLNDGDNDGSDEPSFQPQLQSCWVQTIIENRSELCSYRHPNVGTPGPTNLEEMVAGFESHGGNVKNVPLREGPPTREELLVHYPPKFTWKQLKTFVNSGDLGLLKRDKALQVRYDEWAVGIRAQYGSMVNYLLNHRLQWGKRDTLSLLPSTLEDDPRFYVSSGDEHKEPTPYFCVDTPPEYLSIIQNDWPYSVPADVEHTLIWTKVPIYHPDLVDPKVKPRIDQDGLWGFTGKASPPPSPSALPECLPALAEWGITLDKMIVSEKGTEEEEALVKKAGEKVHEFVKARWNEDIWGDCVIRGNATIWNSKHSDVPAACPSSPGGAGLLLKPFQSTFASFMSSPAAIRTNALLTMSKVILVTGANSGIGYELVKLLATRPEVKKVYLGARNEKSGRDAQSALEKEGYKNVHFVQIDVDDAASIKSAKEVVEKESGRLDVLVNNAGIGALDKDQNATTVDVSLVERVLKTNLLGLIQTTTTLLPLIRASPNGVIVNVSSDFASNTNQAKGGYMHPVAYNTSKAAVNSYTIALAHELKGDGIKVNAVSPGFTKTKLNGFMDGGKDTKKGAEVLVPWVLLDKDGPTGLFIGEDGKELPW
ncbi:hypothetical protein NMY22_g1294 [Coprinellus aureogranulatus]|nr:hypothetical protein NMY22_g1294 [Coprinellus aureogranulatus]